jgi:hypothetical protein
VSVVGVQHFATGGLISKPTLALAGEAGPEAVLPLNDPKALRQIGQAIAAASGGGGTHLHVNVEGLISPDNLGKVMEQMSNRVRKGQGTLHASNTFRVTKRSA